jgi:hypothetical protein
MYILHLREPRGRDVQFSNLSSTDRLLALIRRV